VVLVQLYTRKYQHELNRHLPFNSIVIKPLKILCFHR